MSQSSEDATLYKVVVNHEGQYSLWLADQALPDGWTEEGTSGIKRDCLAHIESVWTDMRPISLRNQPKSS